MNTAGAIAGHYVDANGMAHGFARAVDGTITSFDAPGVSPGSQGTYGQSINTEGAITGNYTYFSGSNIRWRSFVRAVSGEITTFTAPGTDMTRCEPVAQSISAAGAITGYCWDSSGTAHGFLVTR
jgi:hypothetical protein